MCVMHSKSDNIEIMFQNTADEVIEKLFESSLKRYQIGLEASMKGSDFIFSCVNLLYYQCYKINMKRGVLYIDSVDWIKKTIVASVTLNHKEIGKNLQRKSKIRPFIS